MQSKQLFLLHMECTVVELCVAEPERHLDLAVLAVYCVCIGVSEGCQLAVVWG